MKTMNMFNIPLIIFCLTVTLLVTNMSLQPVAGIGQPLRLEQMDDMRAIVGPLCNERIPICQNLTTIVESAETNVGQAQTELQAGNTSGAMMMLSNAEQVLSALRGNMTAMIGGR
jgi:hypothetical protein